MYEFLKFRGFVLAHNSMHRISYYNSNHDEQRKTTGVVDSHNEINAPSLGDTLNFGGLKGREALTT